MKKCKICLLEKELSEFSPCGKYKDKIYYRRECHSCNSLQQKSEAGKIAQEKYRNSEKGRINKQRHKKTDKYKKWQTEYYRKKYKEDSHFRLKKLLRDRLLKALKAKRWNKNTHFSTYIGCSLEELKSYLESQFQSGMSWDNQGIAWEIDHKIPLASAKNEEELYKLNHYTNLQPLFIKDHLIKSAQDTKEIKSSKEQ